MAEIFAEVRAYDVEVQNMRTRVRSLLFAGVERRVSAHDIASVAEIAGLNWWRHKVVEIAGVAK
jgi:hypothetical protein